MRRILLLLLLMVPLTAVRADALSVRDVIELSRAGLGDEVLLALIQVDRTVFPIDSATLKQLKEAGVSETVIAAMIRSGRVPDEPQAQVQEAPAGQEPIPAQDIQQVSDEPTPAELPMVAQEPVVREVAVPIAVPVYVPVVVPVHHDRSRRADGRDRDRPKGPVCAEGPNYWGFGGKLRPDAYAPPGTVRCK